MIRVRARISYALTDALEVRASARRPSFNPILQILAAKGTKLLLCAPVTRPQGAIASRTAATWRAASDRPVLFLDLTTCGGPHIALPARWLHTRPAAGHRGAGAPPAHRFQLKRDFCAFGVT
jgi:hypothetical protein